MGCLSFHLHHLQTHFHNLFDRSPVHDSAPPSSAPASIYTIPTPPPTPSPKPRPRNLETHAPVPGNRGPLQPAAMKRNTSATGPKLEIVTETTVAETAEMKNFAENRGVKAGRKVNWAKRGYILNPKRFLGKLVKEREAAVDRAGERKRGRWKGYTETLGRPGWRGVIRRT
ncbi:hypothetical protein EX30DRAFT_344691 [Ascodesmis nigricans]|uniref:Uncharacterized protein n=1 Tax=Ascodesmis nigricans TaxID=341454 RepID=A0A4V3SHL1_9PEZI|nr:hypothetical protein EX30DRAFT_344691 [Ascodesmis nigricans]